MCGNPVGEGATLVRIVMTILYNKSMTPDKIFKYCPVCKNEVVFEINKITCQNCGLEYYTNPAPCNGIIVRKNDSILLVRRKLDPQKGKLDFAGGFIEAGETAEESVKREIREELGCELSSLSYFKSYADVYTFNNVTYRTLGIIFVATIKDDATITPGDDVAGYEYIPMHEIPYDQIAFESVARALKDYINSA